MPRLSLAYLFTRVFRYRRALIFQGLTALASLGETISLSQAYR